MANIYLSLIIFTVSITAAPLIILKSVKIRLVLFLILLSTSIFTFRYMNQIDGTSSVLSSATKLSLIAFTVSEDKTYIYLWGIPEGATEPANLKIPFNREVVRQLKQARREAGGQPANIEIKPIKMDRLNPLDDTVKEVKVRPWGTNLPSKRPI